MNGPAGRLSDIGESIGDALLRRAGRIAARVQERRGVSTDVLESEDAYRIVFNSPGVTGSDIQVRYLDGGVSLRIDRFRDFHEGYEMLYPGRGVALDGRVDLPEEAAVDADRATATLTDRGTLKVDLPKREHAPARTEFDDPDGRIEFEDGDDADDSE